MYVDWTMYAYSFMMLQPMYLIPLGTALRGLFCLTWKGMFIYFQLGLKG